MRPIAENGVGKVAEQQTAWDELIARIGSLVDAGVEDCRGVLAGVARLVVPEYADFCLVDLNELEPPIRLVAQAEGGEPNVVFSLPESPVAAAMQEIEDPSLKAGWLSDTAVTVPVKSGNRTLGIVSLINRSTERPYGPPNVNMAEALATQVATLATRAEAYQAAHSLLVQAEAKAGRLRLLTRTALKIQSAPSVQAMLQTIADGARAVTGAGMGFVLFGPDPHAVPLQASSLADRYADWRLGTLPPEVVHLAEQVCRKNTATRLNRAELMARDQETLPLAGWLAYPLRSRNGRNVGLVHVSAKDRGEFSAEDEELLGQVAEMGAGGLENIQLWRSA
ncbi:MAG: GAF domain-containing protein, partial [Mycobacterium leprae]